MILRLLALAFAALLVPSQSVAQARTPGAAAPSDAARTEIERILDADNLDSARLSARDVAETIAGIARGGAPEDFWTAYQRHVRAWARLADAVDRARRAQGESSLGGMEEVEAAAQAVETTFDEVERIALRYGARLPVPPVDTQSIA